MSWMRLSIANRFFFCFIALLILFQRLFVFFCASAGLRFKKNLFFFIMQTNDARWRRLKQKKEAAQNLAYIQRCPMWAARIHRHYSEFQMDCKLFLSLTFLYIGIRHIYVYTHAIKREHRISIGTSHCCCWWLSFSKMFKRANTVFALFRVAAVKGLRFISAFFSETLARMSTSQKNDFLFICARIEFGWDKQRTTKEWFNVLQPQMKNCVWNSIMEISSAK